MFVIGSIVTTAALGAIAILLGIQGGAFQSQDSHTAHSDEFAKEGHDLEGGTYCTFSRHHPNMVNSAAVDLETIHWSDVNVSAPTVPTIETSWSTKPGSKTTTFASGHRCLQGNVGASSHRL